MAVPPSGDQVELSAGALRCVVVEVGGGLREVTFGNWPVLDGFAVDAQADGGRGQPLLPWPNRLGGGRYEFDGQDHQLPIDDVDRHTAIHGLTRWLSWSVVDRAPNRVEVAHKLRPRPGYPFWLDLSIAYQLTETTLTVTTTARNVGSRPLPFGAGQHPYLTVGTSTIDPAWLQVIAAERLELDAEQRLPTGRRLSLAGSSLDFCRARPIGSLVLDECLTGLTPDVAGRVWAELSDPPSGRAVKLWAEAPYKYLQIYSGETLHPGRRRQGLAVEPMTCPPDAFRSGIDVLVLQPGDSTVLRWGLQVIAPASQ